LANSKVWPTRKFDQLGYCHNFLLPATTTISNFSFRKKKNKDLFTRATKQSVLQSDAFYDLRNSLQLVKSSGAVFTTLRFLCNL
jgi:hypothetical protein